MTDRPYEPTPKRLREARARGDVPRAPLLAGAAGGLVLVALVPSLFVALARRLSFSMEHLAETTRLDAWSLGAGVVALVAPIALGLIAVAVISSLAQGGLVFAPSRLVPGAERSGSPRAWSALRGLMVVLLLSFFLGHIVFEVATHTTRPVSGLGEALAFAGRSARRIALVGVALTSLVGVVDLLVSRRAWLARLRMTRAEVLRERKDEERDPELARRHRALLVPGADAIEPSTSDTLRAVGESTVLVSITAAGDAAFALHYRDDDDDEAPTLVARGEGRLAAAMRDAAQAHDIPVIAPPDPQALQRVLGELPIGSPIPASLYAEVAEVLRLAGQHV